MFKKTMYIMACIMVIVTNNCSNAFRKGMFIKNITVIETTIED